MAARHTLGPISESGSAPVAGAGDLGRSDVASIAPASVAPEQVDLELVIPAYNEERRLGPTVLALAEELRGLPLSAALRVIDNGSSDRTAECVDRLSATGTPVTVTGCSRRGKGAAVARGMVTTPAARWVGFCDADLATPAAAIEDALALLRDGWQVVIGSRRCSGARIPVRQPVLRRMGSAGFRLLTRRFSGSVRDTQCGFKFFQAEAARQVFTGITATGFAFDLEVIARARALGLTLAEFPVAWSDKRGSSFRVFADGRRVVGELWRLHRELPNALPRPAESPLAEPRAGEPRLAEGAG
ncbi:glycosyltransferase [Streptomyces lunalinharesii]|uniref:glycosyltransferase n=1 Tax=Streptomyces lunalinharesii TaxID=333384 RepID=UPI0031DDB1C6